MRTRIRIDPFTFGRSGIRISSWRRGTGFSIPLFNRKARSFGKIKLGIFSFHFESKAKKQRLKNSQPENVQRIRKSHNQAYDPWTIEADKRLLSLFRQGKTVKELSKIFGRTNGAIRSRINKLLLK